MGTKELEILLCEIPFVNKLLNFFFTSKKICEMIAKKNTSMYLICQYTNTKQNYCFKGYIKFYIIKI